MSCLAFSFYSRGCSSPEDPCHVCRCPASPKRLLLPTQLLSCLSSCSSRLVLAQPHCMSSQTSEDIAKLQERTVRMCVDHNSREKNANRKTYRSFSERAGSQKMATQKQQGSAHSGNSRGPLFPS